MKKPTKKKKDKLSTHKKKAWASFSSYIRTRDPLCVTCGAPTKHAGHFIDGRRNAVLFSEEGVHGQCAGCNIYLHGNKLQYWLFMEKTYGRATIERLILESKQIIKYTASDYDEIAQTYEKKLDELLNKG